MEKRMATKLGLFVTCYDEIEAIRFALNSANNIYKNIPIYVNCESNEDLSCLYEDGLNVSINYYEDTLSGVLGITEHSYLTEQNQKNIIKATKAILDRIEDSINFLNSEYILLHCPDTLIRGELTIPKNSYLLGSRVNGFSWETINQLLIQNGGVRITHFGAVPAIFKTETFLLGLEKAKSIPYFIEKLSQAFYVPFSHDILIPIIFSLVGKIEEFNSDIVECTRNPNWSKTNHPLVHQFREKYPPRKSKYKVNEKI